MSLSIILPVKAEPALVSILHSLGFTNIAQSTTETFLPGTYEVTLFAEFAAYHASNTLSWYIVGTSSYTLLYSGSEGNFGYVSPPIVKTFMTNDQFGLSFRSPEARYFTETSRNTDGVKHALIFADLENPDMFLLGFENLYGGGDRDYQDMVISLELIRPAVVKATLDINPDTLNLKSQGQWITAYIQIPEGFNPEYIDATTVLLNETIQPVLDPKYGFVTNPIEYLVDHNEDGMLERMVKFDRAMVESFIYDQGVTYDEVSLTITGELFDGTPFEGTDVIFVNYAGDANNDGMIDIFDIGTLNAHWYPGPPTGTLNYDSSCDFNNDEAVDIFDIGILSVNWRQTTP